MIMEPIWNIVHRLINLGLSLTPLHGTIGYTIDDGKVYLTQGSDSEMHRAELGAEDLSDTEIRIDQRLREGRKVLKLLAAWGAQARDISNEMAQQHCFETLAEAQIVKLATELRRLDRLREFHQIFRDVPTKNMLLSEIRKAIIALQTLDGLSGFLKKKLQVPDDFDEHYSSVEWTNAIPHILENVAEYGRHIEAHGTVRDETKIDFRTELSGRYLPELFNEIYGNPNHRTFKESKENSPEGPGYTFVQLAFSTLGYGSINPSSIAKNMTKMNRHLKKDTSRKI